ncbi:IS4 family transposase [Streptomyces sp. NPDC058231]|uniref:IS4 family transposase n=1 Tax=Streptomyces sp. NPDC058231 TaxID=3346392 RepID=UPI0036E1D7B5
MSVHEQHLIPGLLHRIGPGMMLLADRGITGFDLWQAASSTGADLLWRVRKNIVLPVLQAFDDGSYLSEIVVTGDRERRDPARVRVIEYTLGGPREDTVYRLITTVCDPKEAPATDLAVLYHQRWEIENTLDELKTHQGGRQLVLRSQYPEGVEQEIYGFLLVHHALRDVMHQAAHHAGLDPDRISFTRTLNTARRHVTDQAALPPPDSTEASLTPFVNSSNDSCHPADHAPTPASSNAICPTGTSNTPTTTTHHHPLQQSHSCHLPKPPASARNIAKSAVLRLESQTIWFAEHRVSAT